MSEFARRGGWWVAAQLVLFAAFVLALRVNGDPPAWLGIVGWLVTLLGVALIAGGLLTLGPNLTPYPEPVPTGRLVERGVYRIVRHPIYGGLCIGAVGLAVGRASIPALAVSAVMLVFFRRKARGEERRLAAAYAEYAGYQRRVRAVLIPWLY